MNLIPRHETCLAGCRANSPVCERGVCLMTFAVSGVPDVDPAEAIRQRRAGKPRVPKGEKPPPGKR